MENERIKDSKTPEQILKSTLKQFNDLDSQANEAICENMDKDTYREKLTERAQLIVDLPFKIQVSVRNGNPFPETKMDDIKYMALLAKKALEKVKVPYLLSAFLDSHDENSPNYLEELVNDLYPSK